MKLFDFTDTSIALFSGPIARFILSNWFYPFTQTFDILNNGPQAACGEAISTRRYFLR